MKNSNDLQIWNVDYFVIDQIADVPDIIDCGMHYHDAVSSGVNIFRIEEVLRSQLNAEKNKSNREEKKLRYDENHRPGTMLPQVPAEKLP